MDTKCCPYLFVCLVHFFRQVISCALQLLQWELGDVTRVLCIINQMSVQLQDGIAFLQLMTHILEWFVLLHKNGTVIPTDSVNFETASESLSFIHMWCPKFRALRSSSYLWFQSWYSLQFLYNYQALIWAPATVYNCLASSQVLFQAWKVCCGLFTYLKTWIDYYSIYNFCTNTKLRYKTWLLLTDCFSVQSQLWYYWCAVEHLMLLTYVLVPLTKRLVYVKTFPSENYFYYSLMFQEAYRPIFSFYILIAPTMHVCYE